MADQHEEKYLEFAAAYVLSALDGDELREFETHVKTGCTTCASEIVRLADAAAILPMGLQQTEPSQDLKERIMFSVQLAQVAKATFQPETADEKEGELAEAPAPVKVRRKPVWRPWFSYGLSFAMIVMLVGFFAYISSLFRTIQQQDDYIVSQRIYIVELRDSLQRLAEIVNVLESRQIEIVTMAGLKPDSIGYGKIIWDPIKRVAILHVSNLPPVPENKEYQLWVIRDRKPISAGVFAVRNEKDKQNFFKVQSINVPDRTGVNAFAVTLEPRGGVPQPTGEMYLLGKVSAQ
ncbi:MAG: anti-sigma factor [Ignavibacteriae bacterium]|nr:anti-sigma factor [Ignavibacteria bacterium]MBI3365845.1 anti-sigma factor [Ignavibacteriota bacterium]